MTATVVAGCSSGGPSATSATTNPTRTTVSSSSGRPRAQSTTSTTVDRTEADRALVAAAGIQPADLSGWELDRISHHGGPLAGVALDVVRNQAECEHVPLSTVDVGMVPGVTSYFTKPGGASFDVNIRLFPTLARATKNFAANTGPSAADCAAQSNAYTTAARGLHASKWTSGVIEAPHAGDHSAAYRVVLTIAGHAAVVNYGWVQYGRAVLWVVSGPDWDLPFVTGVIRKALDRLAFGGITKGA